MGLLLLGMWDLPGSGIKPLLLHWQVDSLPLSHQGSSHRKLYLLLSFTVNLKLLFKTKSKNDLKMVDCILEVKFT